MIHGIDSNSYDPLIHAQEGLTMYFGSRKYSPDYFRVYEKGKEQNASLPEGDIDRAYFRIEHEMKRPDGKTEIPLDVMIRPDSYFGNGRSNLRDLMDEMKEFYKLETSEERQRNQIRKKKNKSLSKKAEWLRSTGGRTFKTLLDTLPKEERAELLSNPIIAYLVRPEGLKEFINDLDDPEFNVLEAMILSGITPEYHNPKNDRVPLNVSGKDGEWTANRVKVDA